MMKLKPNEQAKPVEARSCAVYETIERSESYA